jgi:hypothetical protein
MKFSDDLDGVIFIENDDLKLVVEEDGDEWESLQPLTALATAESAAGDQILYEKKLASWKDLTTLPKTRNKCVKYFKSKFPKIKTCIGWKLETRWYYRKATLKVTTSVPTNIGDIVEDCMKEAAVVAAIAGLITGGSAAAAAAQKAFTLCIGRKIGDKLLDVDVDMSGSWGGWS